MKSYLIKMKIYFTIIITFAVWIRMTNCLLDDIQTQLIEAKYHLLSLEVENLKQKVAEIDQLKQTIAAVQTQLVTQVNRSEPIAFTATLTTTITNLGSPKRIVFNHVTSNIGNGYSPLHGIFTAPVKGAYVFFVILTTIPQHSANAALMKNGQNIGNVLAHGNIGLYVTSTIAVTVQLESGDQVWVQNTYPFSAVEELDGSNFSYFSGHLIGKN